MNHYFRRIISVIELTLALGIVSHSQTITWEGLNGPSGINSVLTSGQDYDDHIFVSTFSPTYVYRSSDDGLTWDKTDLINQEVYGFVAKDNGLMLAAAYSGVYKSIDHGMHWLLINDSINSNISIHISNHGIIYIGTWYQGLVQSTNDGVTWTRAGLFGHPIQSINSDSFGILFVVTTDSGGYRSTDEGATWSKINSLKYQMTDIVIRSDNKIYATDSRNLYSSIDEGITWENIYSDQNAGFRIYQVIKDTLFGASYIGLIRSTDEGRSWQIKKWLPYFMTPSSLIITHNNSLIVGLSPGGYLRSTNSGNSWITVGEGMGFLPITAVCSDTSGITFAGTYQGVFKNHNENGNWENAVGIDSLISPFAVSSLLRFNSGKLLAGGYGGIYSTQNNGTNWNYYAIGDTRAFALSTSGVVIAANSWYTIQPADFFSDIYRSSNAGISWEKIFTTGHINGFIQSKIGNMFAWTAFGIIRSSDDGLTWDTLSFNSDPLHWNITPVQQMIASPTGFLLCISNDSVFVSYNEGITWKSTSALNKVSALIAGSSGTIYAGTQDQGVLVSIDSGVTWNQANSGLSNHNISCLSISSNGKLLCGTKSGGVFRSLQTIVGVQKTTSFTATDFRLIQNYPNPFNPTTKIKYSIPQTTFVSLRLYDILGKEVATLVNEKKTAGNYEINFEAKNLSSGVYFYQFKSENFIQTKKMLLIK